jgi:hypothetical protein
MRNSSLIAGDNPLWPHSVDDLSLVLFGTLTRVPSIPPSSLDAYAAFAVRSMMFGATAFDDQSQLGIPLWNHYEGCSWWRDKPGMVGAFQIGLQRCHALPLIPALSHAVAALNQLGRLDLTGVLARVPTHLHNAPFPYLAETLQWFSRPRQKAEVAASIRVEAVGLEPMRAIHEAFDIAPFAVDRLHQPEGDTLTAEARLPEWTSEAIGWFIAYLATLTPPAKVQSTVVQIDLC